MKQKRLNTLLIDGNNMAYRAKYSFQLSFRGRDTSVLYGCMRILSTLAKEFTPWSIVVMWDGGLPLFRREAVSSYKSTRERDADYYTFKEQMDELHAWLPKFGIYSIKRPGIEADDFLFHGSRLLEESAIVTTDADLLQAVSPRCSIIKPTKTGNLLIEHGSFVEHVGVQQHKFLMYKCLLGDSSDAIKGCTGIGSTTAIKLLAAVDNPTPEEIISACKTPKMRENLIQYFSSRYADVRKVVDLEEDTTGARYVISTSMPHQKFDRKEYFRFCSTWGFSSLIEHGAAPVEFAKLIAAPWNFSGITLPRIWDYYRGQQE